MTRRYDSDGDDAAAAMAARDAQRDAVGDALEAAAATLELLSTYRLTYRHRQRLAETARAIERGLAAHRARAAGPKEAS
jgi:hypothetical protein